MRRRGVQMVLATLMIAANCRILLRERFTGQLRLRVSGMAQIGAFL
jgi:hypothetical protein